MTRFLPSVSPSGPIPRGLCPRQPHPNENDNELSPLSPHHPHSPSLMNGGIFVNGTNVIFPSSRSRTLESIYGRTSKPKKIQTANVRRAVMFANGLVVPVPTRSRAVTTLNIISVTNIRENVRINVMPVLLPLLNDLI